MKVHLKPIAIVILILLTLGACHKDKPVSHSGCKSGDQKAGVQAVTPGSDTTCIAYRYFPSENKLMISHYNAAFNCCPGEILCDVEVDGDTITLHEKEKKGECDCLCLYDLEVEVGGVSEKTYHLIVEEPYAHGQAQLSFDADLAADPVGSHCLERTIYPWGI